MNVKEVFHEESVKQLIQGAIDSYNKFAVSNAQKVQKFIVLSTDFSVLWRINRNTNPKEELF